MIISEQINNQPSMIVIGASFGGLQILRDFLPAIASQSYPIVVVQHIPINFDNKWIKNINLDSPLKIIEDGMPIESGHMYFAPSNYHVLIEPNCRFALDNSEVVCFARPSIDVTFECAARIFKNNTIGIILSGANSDGAFGLSEIYRLGGICYVLDPDLATCDVMGKQALEMVPQALCKNLADIVSSINLLCKKRVNG